MSRDEILIKKRQYHNAIIWKDKVKYTIYVHVIGILPLISFTDRKNGDDDTCGDDDVCEQMSGGSEGVHSMAPIGHFLPRTGSTLFCLLGVSGPYRRCTNPLSITICLLAIPSPSIPIPGQQSR